jgi:hypothetical protein
MIGHSEPDVRLSVQMVLLRATPSRKRRQNSRSNRCKAARWRGWRSAQRRNERRRRGNFGEKDTEVL